MLNKVNDLVIRGKARLITGAVAEALENGCAPGDILSTMIAAMDVVGDRFQNGEIFVPEMLIAAKAMKKGVEELKPHLAAGAAGALGKVVIGTVAGDLHDIGKNLVAMMIESAGFEIIDLGVDVPVEKFVSAARAEGVKIVACSALLTTTMPVMEEVVKAAEAAGIRDQVKIMIGGAPVTPEFCQQIGADAYTPDAASAADQAVAFCS